MSRVVVIMSVFNGEPYLREQIDSVLAQSGVDVQLWVRDDGSTDATPRMLGEYACDKRVRWIAGENLGAADSFMEAVRLCPMRGDYYGFCDADDMWLKDKLSIAVQELEPLGIGAAMVCSTVTITDSYLSPRGRTVAPPKGLSFRNALVQTVTCGATCLMNQSAFDLVRSEIPSRGKIRMHDAWVYLVMSAFGTIRFYDRPGVLYRQHDRNVFGTGHSFSQKVLQRVRRLSQPSRYWEQACEFHARYGARMDLAEAGALRRYVEHRGGMLRRLVYALSPSFECQRWQAGCYLRLLCLIGRG